MQEKQVKERKKYTAPQLVKMGDFKKSTGYDGNRKLEFIFVWPRLI